MIRPLLAAAALALLVVPAAAAPSPEGVTAKALARVAELVAREAGRDAREVAELDRRAGAQWSAVAPLGWRAAAPLGAAARDPKLAPKVRFFAVVFLGKLADPAAFEPLSAVLLDADSDDDARLAAAQSLNALDVPAAAARRTFCAAAARADGSRALREEVAVALARLGCEDPAALEKAARAYGPRPSGADLTSVRRAVAGVGASRGAAGVRALLGLVAYFPPGGEPRAAAIAALGARREDLAGPLSAEALPVLREALRSESGSPAPMRTLVALDDALDPADDALLPLASHPDAAVLADAAAALARRGAVKALPALEAVLAGALHDPRFAPRKDGADPAVLLGRLEEAVTVLRRVRAARP